MSRTKSTWLILSFVVLASAAAERALAKAPAATRALTWTKLADDPGPRYATPIVWDAALKRVLVFGGETNVFKPKFGFVFHSDLWAYDVKTAKWTDLKPEGQGPSERAYHAACYDTKRKGMWLHGGFRGAFYDDLWFFDGKKNVWKQVKVEGTAPSPRDAHDLHYDAAHDRLVLFGGLNDFQGMRSNNELWIFDIKQATWSQQKSGPGARFCCCSALDKKGETLYLTGGFGAGGRAVDAALWIHDLKKNTWSSVKGPLGSQTLVAGRMVHVPATGHLLVNSGSDTNTSWWYDIARNKWTTASQANAPEGRSYHGMCFDPKGRRMYVLGGTRGGFTGKCVAGNLWAAEFGAGKPAGTSSGQ